MTGNPATTFFPADPDAIVPDEDRVRRLLRERGWIASSLDRAETHPDPSGQA